jgi:hypothetical protein
MYTTTAANMKQPRKKPSFFTRWLNKKITDAYNSNLNHSDLPVSPRIDSLQNIDQPERAIRFTVYIANGGRVVETVRYDKQKDRHHNGLYIVTSDQDFGKEIDKIITMEALR